MDQSHFTRLLLFSVFILSVAAFLPIEAVAQDEGRIVLQRAQPDASSPTTQQFSTAQATDFTMLPSVTTVGAVRGGQTDLGSVRVVRAAAVWTRRAGLQYHHRMAQPQWFRWPRAQYQSAARRV